MSSNTDLVAAGYQAFATQDVPTLLAMFDPAIEWYSPDELPEGGHYRGPDEVLQFFGKLQDTYTEFRVEPERLSALDDGRVLVEGHYRGRVGGTRFDVEFVHVWSLRDSVATTFRDYCDSGKLLVLLQDESVDR